MKYSRFLIATGYWLALLLLVLPLLERVVTLLPFSPRAIRWRLEAFGALSQSLALPLIGGVVAIGTAYLLGHRKVVRALAISAYLAAATLAVLTTLSRSTCCSTTAPLVRTCNSSTRWQARSTCLLSR